MGYGGYGVGYAGGAAAVLTSDRSSYNVVSVRRTPQASGVPVYLELGPLYPTSFTIMDHKHMMASEATFNVGMRTLDPDTKTALRDLAAQPLEVWVYRDGTRIFAGPVTGGTVHNDNVVLQCRGRLFYLAYMYVTADKSWTATDLFTIGKELVDDWQTLTYGHFGLLTASIGTLGTTRNWEIPGATEFPQVGEMLRTLSAGSFDIWENASNGNLEFAASRGTDLSTSVVIERGVTDSSAGFALGPGILASEVFAAGTTPTTLLTDTTSQDAAVRASFGRAGVAVTFDPVSDANHLGDLADALLSTVDHVYWQPGGELYEVPEATFEDVAPGNRVEYSYDAGLGKVTLTPRIQKRQLSVEQDGKERIYVEFE